MNRYTFKVLFEIGVFWSISLMANDFADALTQGLGVIPEPSLKVKQVIITLD